MTLSLTLACTDYEWLEPLIRGDVEPDGIDLTVLTDMGGGERHWRTVAGEFDIAEFSLGTYITGWPEWEFTAIPAFPRRFWPHSRIFVNSDAGIDTPTDLEGKRVGLSSYQNTLALWTKGVLAEHYGVDLEAVNWCTSKPEPVDVDLSVDLERIDRASRPEQLARGDLDALFMPSTEGLYPLADTVERLFDDLQTAEGEYYDTTGFYPLMHNVVVRNELIDEEPWVPTELLRLFRRSQEIAAERARYEAKYPLVWWQQYREQERETVGDVWGRSFEFNANAEELRTMIRYADEQGLITEQFDPEEMFVRADQNLL
jgi:4,5-dihydroxyphthalate decarboxylase